MRDSQSVGYITFGSVVAGYRVRGRPLEIVMEDGRKPIIISKACVGQGLFEAGDRPSVHLFVWPVPTVHPHDPALVAIEIRIAWWPSECLSPVGRKSLRVLRVEPMAERVAHYLVGHHPGMPGRSQPPDSVIATSSVIDRFHEQKVFAEGKYVSPSKRLVRPPTGPKTRTSGRRHRLIGSALGRPRGAIKRRRFWRQPGQPDGPGQSSELAAHA